MLDATKREEAPVRALGHLLRTWRGLRHMSQLDLAMRAGFSSRHVSFIETGRAQPSRQALLALGGALDMPLRDRNRLLEAGGFAPLYRQRPLADTDMRHVHTMLQFILDRHEPYGAVVLDRLSNIVMSNRPATHLFSRLVDPALLTPPVNLLRLVFQPDGLRRAIVNWDDVARHLIDRTERELGGPDADRAATDLLEELRALAPPPDTSTAHSEGRDLLLPIHLRTDDAELRLFSAIMTIGTPRDITLQELRIETFFPADEESARHFGPITPQPERAPAATTAGR